MKHSVFPGSFAQNPFFTAARFLERNGQNSGLKIDGAPAADRGGARKRFKDPAF